MPAYISSPFKPSPKLCSPGIPVYLWGNFPTDVAPTFGYVLSTSGNGSTSTVVVKIMGGNIPVVSAFSIPLITIVGTANSAGGYNVTNVALISVSAAQQPDQGVYTFTFAGSGTSAAAPDAGQFLVPQPEISEALTEGPSAPVVMPYNIVNSNLNQAVTVVASFPSLPTSVVLSLQQALQDISSEYATVAVIATVAGGSVTTGPQITVNPTLGRFFRVLNGAVVGGTVPTAIVKLMI